MLLLASGRGTRLGAEIPKAYVPVRGVPLVVRSMRRLAALADAREMVLAVHPEDREPHVAPLAAAFAELGRVTIVDGGATRQESMERAFAATGADCDVVLVHDAARPFFPVAATRVALERAQANGGSLLAIRAPDTLKHVADDGHVEHTVDRSHIWLAQTPQCVRRDSLIAALAHASRTGFVGTDDVSLLEHAGIPVEVVVGDRLNLKITTPDDLVLAEAIAAVDDPR